MKKKINYIRKICSRFQAKLLLAFLLCTLLPLLVIGGISYSVSYNISEQRILNASIFSDDQLNLQINERLSHVESVADSMQYDMYTLMQAEEPMECLSALTDTRNNLSLFKSTFDLYYASIFLPSGHLGADEGLYFFPLDDLKKYSIPASALTNPGASSIWFLQKNVSVPFSISGSNKSSDCMACCRILKDTETKRIRYAYILFLDIKEFSGYLEESFADKNIASYILTDQGELVAHNSPDKISCPDKELLESLKKESGTVFYKNKINYHCVRLQNGWYHITEIPDSYIQENVRVLIQSILLILLFSLPLTILIILFISKKLTKKIRILSGAMEHLTLDSPKEDLSELIPPGKDPETYDEIDRLGLTFQKMQLSLKENIVLILNKIKKIPRQEAEALAEDMLKRVRLEAEMDKMPAFVSGGQAQRASIARALATDLQLIFLDEPTAALDPILTGEVLRVIQELKGSGKDFIFVTHELKFLRNFADYILFMDKGKIVEKGPVDCLEAPQTPLLKKFIKGGIDDDNSGNL